MERCDKSLVKYSTCIALMHITHQPFANVWTDMVLHQTVNLEYKSKDGAIGVIQKHNTFKGRILTCLRFRGRRRTPNIPTLNSLSKKNGI